MLLARAVGACIAGAVQHSFFSLSMCYLQFWLLVPLDRHSAC